jgi:uncharacterized protein
MTEHENTVVDLRALDLVSGGATRLDLEVPVEDLVIAGQRYRVVPPGPSVALDLSLSLSGWLFRLRFSAAVVGPCSRCLEEATFPLEVDAREFAAAGRGPDAPFDEDLDCEYLTGDRLDVSAWVRDSVVEALPGVIVCREECAGICPTCGANLNEGPCGCPQEVAIDARWGPLAGLAERLRKDQGAV